VVNHPSSDLGPLFGPVARRTDPVTSKLAARDARATAGAQRSEILRQLEVVGVQGLTNDQLDYRLEWRTGTASRRIAELVRSGQVVRTARQRVTRTGSRAFVHIRQEHRGHI